MINLVEEMFSNYKKIIDENQKLKDEINLLKGEKTKPDISGSKKKDKKNESSEKERKKRRKRKKKKSKAKNYKIKPDRTRVCPVDKRILPADAEFKGHQPVMVQELIIKTENVEYKREVFYSPSEKKTYIGPLPPGIKGGYGPGVISYIYTQKHATNVSEPKITEFLNNAGIFISQSTVSRFLTTGIDIFHQEKADIVLAGLCSTAYQQIDDTGARVNGENQYVQILCNPYYTAFFTVPKKNRLTVLDILLCGRERNYFFNSEAFDLLKIFRVSNKVINQLQSEVADRTLNEKQLAEVLKKLFPNPKKGNNTRTRIKEAGAIAAYHNQTDVPVIQTLLSDDAPQFKHITQEQALCWVHDGRHYKKLYPIVPLNRDKLDEFSEQYWDYYAKLLEYRENPTENKADQLSKEFDELFSTRTDYEALDDRIAKTKAKKSELLLVLKYPDLPLHNNNSELAARAEKRKQDVSLHTITDEGTKSKDTFLTIAQTAKKLGVSVYEYIHDRVSKNFNMPSLASIIKAKSSEIDCYDTS
ncbi:transposase [candidate division KSB1 bacterium]|nr:transposase [candidate division KSB1 bacterium]